MTVVKMPRPMHMISIGWYLASSVPDDKYHLLNKQLMILKTRGHITKIIDCEIGKVDPSCGYRDFHISPEFIWMPLAILIGPMVLAIIGMIIARFAFLIKEEKVGALNHLAIVRSTSTSTDGNRAQ